MAITDAGQITEAEGTTRVNRMTLSGSVKAGGLMLVGGGGRRDAGGYLNLQSITDSRGHTWQKHPAYDSSYRAAHLAWCRAVVPLQSGVDWIEWTWNVAPEYAGITGHVFEGASETATEKDRGIGESTQASRSVVMAGSDDLVAALVTYAYNDTTTTPLNSMTEQDTFDGENVCIELLTRNVTSGPGSFTAGTGFAASRNWNMAVISLPYQAMPPAGARAGMLMMGAV